MYVLYNNELKEPRLRVGITKSIPIEEPSPVKLALERLKNYDVSSIGLPRVDGMHCFTYTPSLDNGTSSDFLSCFDEMFDETKGTTPASIERWFKVSADDDTGTLILSKSSSAQTRLRPFVDTAYKLADRLGEDAQQRLDEKLSEFNERCSVQPSEKDTKKSVKRKYVQF